MNRNPLDLPLKQPDTKCNARTPTGYCRQRAGYGTHHERSGRCKYHGGCSISKSNVPGKEHGDYNVQSLYTKMLPTSLAQELIEIKHDPMFTNMFQEYALMKLVVQGLLANLPADLAQIYGKPVCSHCKKKYKSKGEKFFVEYKRNWQGEQKKLDKVIKTIESMSRVFEKISKHEERQKRFILVSELEQLMVRWGQVLMRHFGDDSRIGAVQDEIMQLGFIRTPGEHDGEKLELFRELQRKVMNKYNYRKYQQKKDITVADMVIKAYPELTDSYPPVEEAKVVTEAKTKPTKETKKAKKPFDAAEFLKKNKKRE